MTIQLYLKPNTIGLCFGNKPERDTFWTLLGENQNCAERFGDRTIRFYPDRATSKFSIPLETEVPQVIAEAVEIKQIPPKPALMITPGLDQATMVIPTAPEPIAPIAILPIEQPLTIPGVAVLVVGDPPSPPSIPPQTIVMPQIGSVDALGVSAMPAVSEPPDMRTRAGRALKAQQAAK